MRARAAVLISGNGSNLQALLDSPGLYDLRIVIASKAGAYGLKRARRMGIPILVVPSEKKKEAMDQWISSKLFEYKIEVVCLAGFMRVLSVGFVKQWQGKLVNIHPSMLPSYKGLNAFESAIQNGDDYAGVTVHHVVEAVDSGEFIVQRRFLIPGERRGGWGFEQTDGSSGSVTGSPKADSLQYLALHITEQKLFTEGMRRHLCQQIIQRWS